MEGGAHERRVPKWLARAIGVVTILIVVVFVMIAFRSSKPDEAPAGEATAEEEIDPTQIAADTASGDFLSCTDCHGDLDRSLTNGSYADKLLTYTHKMHFAKGVSDCTNCHPLPAHEPDKTNPPTMGRCFMCHGTAKSSIAPGTCETCHPANSPAVPTTHLKGNWIKDHPESALEAPFECATCHAQSFCESCHGLAEIPHPEGWNEAIHIQTFFDEGIEVCRNCHLVPATPEEAMTLKGRDFCDKCHHDFGGPKDKPWIKYHPEVVKEGQAQPCFECHNPSTCATCHVSGKLNLSADQANFTGLGEAPASTPTEASPTAESEP